MDNIDKVFNDMLDEMEISKRRMIANQFKTDIEFYIMKTKMAAIQKANAAMNSRIDEGIKENLKALNGVKGLIDKI